MASPSTQVAPLRRRGRTVETAPRRAWNLARIEAWVATPRADRAGSTAPEAPSLEEALAMSDEIAGLTRGEPARAQVFPGRARRPTS